MTNEEQMMFDWRYDEYRDACDQSPKDNQETYYEERKCIYCNSHIRTGSEINSEYDTNFYCPSCGYLYKEETYHESN